MLRCYTEAVLKRKQVIDLSEILRLASCFGSTPNFYKYEMLTERELCLYFTAFLNNCHQPVSE